MRLDATLSWPPTGFRRYPCGCPDGRPPGDLHWTDPPQRSWEEPREEILRLLGSWASQGKWCQVWLWVPEGGTAHLRRESTQPSSPTYIVVLLLMVPAPTLPHGDTHEVAEHVAPVAGAALHAGRGVVAAGRGIEVGAGGRARRGALGEVAVRRAGKSCAGQKHRKSNNCFWKQNLRNCFKP